MLEGARPSEPTTGGFWTVVLWTDCFSCLLARAEPQKLCRSWRVKQWACVHVFKHLLHLTPQNYVFFFSPCLTNTIHLALLLNNDNVFPLKVSHLMDLWLLSVYYRGRKRLFLPGGCGTVWTGGWLGRRSVKDLKGTGVRWEGGTSRKPEEGSSTVGVLERWGQKQLFWGTLWGEDCHGLKALCDIPLHTVKCLLKNLLLSYMHLYCVHLQHGKDFEAIQNNIAMKYKKRGKPANMVKNKEQVRHFYYRTWHKISKHIDFASGELLLLRLWWNSVRTGGCRNGCRDWKNITA